MRRLVALLVVVSLVLVMAVPAAHAGGRTATNVALGLASFAVFNQLVGGFFYPRPVYAYPAYYAPYSVVVERPYYVERPVYYAAPAYAYPSQAVGVQPAPQAYPTVVQYPHGRYELRGDGVQTPYQWVWIPNPPPPPAAPPAPQPR
ncbi:MAG TPA: hypothetical protein VFN71_07470 [Methylomirabilota bacterium]|nr:hypothetical protein [Methylomirabilota bacterium]